MANRFTDESTNAYPSTVGTSTTCLSPFPASEKIDPTPILTNKRRRVAGSITANACTNCKKARTKVIFPSDSFLITITLTSVAFLQCDGAKPTCRRCFERSWRDCSYEVHAKTVKNLMLREIRQLQRKNEDLEQQHKALLQKHARVEQFVETLKDDRRFTVVVDRLRRGDNLRSIAQWLGRSTVCNSEVLSPAAEADLTAAVELHHRDLGDKPSVGQLSPGKEPTLALGFMDEWQRARCPDVYGMNTQCDSPSEADDTKRQECVPLSSLLNSD